MNNHKFQFNWLDLPGKQRLVAEAMLFQFSQTEKFPPDQLAQLQLACLQNLVRHCLQHVPYYKRDGYFPIESWDDWRQLPLLDRRTLQQEADSLRSEIDLSKREGRMQQARTSGSTGRPVEVLGSERGQLYWRANTVRDHLWQQRDFSQSLAVIKYLGQDVVAPPGRKSKQWGPASGLLYATGPSTAISGSTDISAQYRWLQELQPAYLQTYPSVLHALAEQNLASNRPLQLLGITTVGESLNPETRSIAKRAFGTRVADVYSCQELGYLALQCPRHDHYHLMAETVLVEILDDDNRPCAPGEMGRVVVTHLHSYATPLIRYAIGDYAIAGGGCDCGIKLPVLGRVLGRTRNLASYPDGSKNWPLCNIYQLTDIVPNAQFQLVQKSLDTLLLRIGTDATVSASALLELKGIINGAMGFDFNMRFEQLATIPRSKSGKFEEFISEIDAA